MYFTCAFVLLLVRYFCLSLYCMHMSVRWIENFIFHNDFIYNETFCLLTYVVCVCVPMCNIEVMVPGWKPWFFIE